MKKVFLFLLVFFSFFSLVSCVSKPETDTPADNTGDKEDNKPNLEMLTAPSLNLNDNIVSWESVKNAGGYIVNKNGVDEPQQTQTNYVITNTEVGNYDIKVKAVPGDTTKYKSSEYSLVITYTISKPAEPTVLSVPAITLKDNMVSWSTVEFAEGYIVNKNGVDQPQQTKTSYEITDTEVGDYVIKVKAISGDETKYKNSDYSETVTYTVKEVVGPVELVPATLYVVGDSTLSSFSDAYYYPRYGYGTQLSNYFDSKLKVNNLALSGRSSKSFITEQNYTTLKNSMKSGDYLLIGFGHNDEKSDDALRFTDASKPITDSTSFKYSLYENYIKIAEEKGVTPILCTPIVRASKDNIYTGSNGHVTSTGDYANAIVELGKEKNVTVINLRDLTKEKYMSIGYSEAIYYHAITAGKYDTGNTTVIPDTNSVDATHLNIYGAKYVAYLVASELKKTENPLRRYVLEDITEPTKEDLVANPNYKVSEYKAPALATYQPQVQFKTKTEGWYGTAFGDCGGTPTSASNGYKATEGTEGVFQVGQTATTAKGKFASAGDGFAYLFRQVEISKNFEITAEAKVIQTANTKQAGFGLMLRDDCFINQNTSKVTILSNYIAAGLITADTNMNAIFKREASTLSKESNVINALYAQDDTATFKIIRLGQSITATVIYKGTTYTKTYLDFDLVASDGQYMYIGMFATRGTVAEFTSVDFKITGESQGA